MSRLGVVFVATILIGAAVGAVTARVPAVLSNGPGPAATWSTPS